MTLAIYVRFSYIVYTRPARTTVLPSHPSFLDGVINKFAMFYLIVPSYAVGLKTRSAYLMPAYLPVHIIRSESIVRRELAAVVPRMRAADMQRVYVRQRQWRKNDRRARRISGRDSAYFSLSF